jgi:hypothetical protein
MCEFKMVPGAGLEPARRRTFEELLREYESRLGCDSFISGCQWVEIVKNRTIFDASPKPNSYIFTCLKNLSIKKKMNVII